MKRQSILFLLLLLLNLLICCGCSGASSPTKGDSAALSLELQKEGSPEQSSQIDLASEEVLTSNAPAYETFENVTGIFEGLEGSHTAVFSFDGAETAFHFEEPAVQKILFEAITGSSYTLSYYLDPVTGLYTIYEIRES